MNNEKSTEQVLVVEDAIQQELVEKVIRIDRVNKVVKGGKRLAFRAFVISGDQNGNVAFGLGKSKEVPAAIKKGIERAKKSLRSIALIEGTIPHDVIGEYGSTRVIIKPAKPGTGVIAGGAVRILLEAAGYKNVYAKVLGSRNSINAARAALDGLLQCKDKANEEKLRGLSLPVFFRKLEADPRTVKAAPLEDSAQSEKRQGQRPRRPRTEHSNSKKNS